MNVYIWGLNKKCDLFRNMLERDENINFKGYLSDRKQCFKYIGGAPVNLLSESAVADCDAVIYVGDKRLNLKTLPSYIKQKVVDSSLFAIPNFDLKKYLQIVREKWCIVSEDCWGGLFYDFMKMEFTSPFINIAIPDEDYYRLLYHLPNCLGITPIIDKEEDLTGYATAKFLWGGG